MVFTGMICAECSVEELRELIAVPLHIERVLRAYARAHVEDAHWIEACLKFRKALAEEFERLLCSCAEGTDQPEVDDGELDAVEQGSRPRSSEPASAKVESREVRGLRSEIVALRLVSRETPHAHGPSHIVLPVIPKR